ncbi:MAG: zinc dependent phospholipase C family protein [Chloroflexi bacterium]|nr:zinc dependent phospholipase C family protein [Chloroflexota bacterium]
MPNLSAHLGMAKEAISRLKHPAVVRNPGACLLGSVSPDIRIITRGQRDETHFAPLSFERMGEGLEGLFQNHPHLADAAQLTEATRSFMVGYACHLFADELWILDMYRPFFGNREVFQDHLQGGLMDRALQLELDRREQRELGGLEVLRPIMEEAEVGVEVGFIQPDALQEWRKWVQESLSWRFTWDRLRFMARRVNSKGDSQAENNLQGMVEEFLESVPHGLERVYRLVPAEKLGDFREKCIEGVLSFAQEYLK